MGAIGRRKSLRLLETAYDAGIRHFDVAPMYGYGEAESCLGDFLQRHGDVTVATKYGIPPGRRPRWISLGRQFVGPALKTLPGLKQRLSKAANRDPRTHERATFTPEEAKASLNRSLALLRVSHIYLWLLHGVSAVDLQDDALLALLREEVRSGRIGTFGVGSDAVRIPGLLASRQGYCRTLQYEWSVLNPTPADTSAPGKPLLRIHHSALTEDFRRLHRTLSLNKPLCLRWSLATDTDLSNPKNLARLMLKASLVANPASIILFSSKNPHHIYANAEASENPDLEAPARELHRLVRIERDQLSTDQLAACEQSTM